MSNTNIKQTQDAKTNHERIPLTAADERLLETFFRDKPQIMAFRLWDRILTLSERQLLGNDFAKAFEQNGTLGMWNKIHKVSKDRAVIELGRRLQALSNEDAEWLLRVTGESEENPEQQMTLAIKAGYLVLRDNPFVVHWKNTEVPVKWNKNMALTRYFWKLVKSTRNNQILDPADLDEELDDAYLSKMKYRLARMKGFPQDLAKLILPAGTSCQKLDLSPNKIFMFES
jgi:hypothetical protein